MSFYNEDISLWRRPRTADDTDLPKSGRPKIGSRNVSFTSGTRPGLSPLQPSRLQPSPKIWTETRSWKRVNRHAQNIDPTFIPSPEPIQNINDTPFLIHTDAFSTLLGSNPTLDGIIKDPRAPYFHSGGTFIPHISTLFLTSDLICDNDPAAVSSARRRTEITKIEFFSPLDFTRDKVRCTERSYMAAGCCIFPNGEGHGLVICAQGSLKEPAGLVYVDTRRPHKTHMLLNNFHGQPFNSPREIVANLADGSLYFTDPSYGYEQAFRPKPQLPTKHIYRFDPESGDCRVVANSISRPTGLAFSPDFSTLYVSENASRGSAGTTIYAFDITYHNPLGSAPSLHISIANHTQTPSSSTNSSGESKSNYRLTPASSPHGANGVSSRNHSRSRSQGPDPRSSTYPAPAPTSHPIMINQNPPSTPSGPFLTNKRLFAYSCDPGSGCISTDPIHGNIVLGTSEGVEVWSPTTGELIGRIMVPDGGKNVSKVAFGNDGEAWLFAGERIWRWNFGNEGGGGRDGRRTGMIAGMI